MILLNKFIDIYDSIYSEHGIGFVIKYGAYEVDVYEDDVDKTSFYTGIVKANINNFLANARVADRYISYHKEFSVNFTFIDDAYIYDVWQCIDYSRMFILVPCHKTLPNAFNIPSILRAYTFFCEDDPVERKKYKNYAGNMEI